nr:hypothetical protein GCM10020241_15830 [Streptoalloteichus tenebrarius]
MRMTAEAIDERDREVPVSSTVRAHRPTSGTAAPPSPRTGRADRAAANVSQVIRPSAAPGAFASAAYRRRTVVDRRFNRLK